MDEPLIWAFIPYFIENGRLDGETFENEDIKGQLARAFNALGLPWVWQPVLLGNLEHIVEQVARYRSRRPAIVFNFCDGFDTDGSPGLSVVRALEAAGIPFTGADSHFYDISSSKLKMKEMFCAAGVATPAYEALPDAGPVVGVCERLGTPVIVKPDLASASVGITLRSRVFTDADITARRDDLKNETLPRHFVHGHAFVERFLDGPEFTVFLVGDWRHPESIRCLPPVERVFDDTLPREERFLSFDRYWARYREETKPPSGNYFFHYAPAGTDVAPVLSDLALRAYRAVRGVSYGRVDIRLDGASGQLHVLEVNANPEVAEEEWEEGSLSPFQTTTGCILQIAGMRFADLLGMIIDDVRARDTG